MDLCNRLKAISPVERKIACLLLEGYSDKEIGSQLGYSRQYVIRIKKNIQVIVEGSAAAPLHSVGSFAGF